MDTREPVDALVRASGLSRRQFAKEHGVGEQVLLRLSQGRFSRVPDSIVQAIYAEYPDKRDIRHMLYDGYGEQEIQDAYAAWRAAQPLSQLPSDEVLRSAEGDSPARKLADAVGSMSKLAKVTRTHDYVVRRYVNGETRELPKSMRVAMEAAGWPHTDQLDRAQQAWFDRQER